MEAFPHLYVCFTLGAVLRSLNIPVRNRGAFPNQFVGSHQRVKALRQSSNPNEHLEELDPHTHLSVVFFGRGYLRLAMFSLVVSYSYFTSSNLGEDPNPK